MKILFVCPTNVVYSLNTNPFVFSLIEGLKRCGHYVDCGIDLFWNSYYNYDILFFQWPEYIFLRNRNLINLEKIKNQFEEIKKKGIKTIVTVHNLHPHNNDPLFTEIYNILYSQVDSFHHLGNYSFKVMKERFPHKYHFIVPHHVANSLLKKSFNQIEAKKKLNIPNRDIVVSSFGAFRNEDEIGMFLEMAYDVGHNHIVYLAPRLPSIGKFYNGRMLNLTFKYLYKFLKDKYLNVHRAGFLSNEDLDLWLTASDIVFIQRKEILNSGNIPLAFSKGKIVVGPNIGNVGEILKETGNYIFSPFDRKSICNTVMDAINNIKNGSSQGKKNYEYAINYWNESTVCSAISFHMKSILFLS